MGVGYISYKIYLPIWIINVCLMLTASWILGLHVIKNHDVEKKHVAIGAFFLIVPWILVSMFFGLGPPPETPTGWVATATEQEIRYIMLVIAGVFMAVGFAALREKLKNTKRLQLPVLQLQPLQQHFEMRDGLVKWLHAFM